MSTVITTATYSPVTKGDGMPKPIICANHFCNLPVIHKEGAPGHIAIHTDGTKYCIADGKPSTYPARLPYAQTPDEIKCVHCDEFIYYFGYQDDPGGVWIHCISDKDRCGQPLEGQGE